MSTGAKGGDIGSGRRGVRPIECVPIGSGRGRGGVVGSVVTIGSSRGDSGPLRKLNQGLAKQFKEK